MLGIPDPQIWIVFLLCILSAAACVVYGVLNWNADGEDLQPADLKWAQEEKEIEEEL